ncbi:MAG: hypothetical protein AB7U85_09495 [Alphaproteobacteria bacterium]
MIFKITENSLFLIIFLFSGLIEYFTCQFWFPDFTEVLFIQYDILLAITVFFFIMTDLADLPNHTCCYISWIFFWQKANDEACDHIRNSAKLGLMMVPLNIIVIIAGNLIGIWNVTFN